MEELLAQDFLSHDNQRRPLVLWYRECGRASSRLLSKLQKHSLIRGLPMMSFKDNFLMQKRKAY